MIHRGTYDGTIYHNPVNKFCIISVKTADKEVPQEARSTRRYRDHLIRFVATGYELPRTDAVELELDGEWTKGKYGVQLQVEQWREIVPKTKSGVEGYLASGLIKGIGPATAAQIVSRFGVETLDIGAVAVLARRYQDCYDRDQYVGSQFYVYISKSKNGQQYLDSMGGAAVTSHKEQYTGAVFLVEQAAMRTAAPQKEDESYE